MYTYPQYVYVYTYICCRPLSLTERLWFRIDRIVDIRGYRLYTRNLSL